MRKDTCAGSSLLTPIQFSRLFSSIIAAKAEALKRGISVMRSCTVETIAAGLELPLKLSQVRDLLYKYSGFINEQAHQLADGQSGLQQVQEAVQELAASVFRKRSAVRVVTPQAAPVPAAAPACPESEAVTPQVQMAGALECVIGSMHFCVNSPYGAELLACTVSKLQQLGAMK